MLEQAGFIEWNPAEAEILQGPEFEDLEPLLQFLDEHPNLLGDRDDS